MNCIANNELDRKARVLKVWNDRTRWCTQYRTEEEDKFVGEGRFPQEGAETSCCPGVGMPRAATFTQQPLNQTIARTAR